MDFISRGYHILLRCVVLLTMDECPECSNVQKEHCPNCKNAQNPGRHFHGSVACISVKLIYAVEVEALMQRNFELKLR